MHRSSCFPCPITAAYLDIPFRSVLSTDYPRTGSRISHKDRISHTACIPQITLGPDLGTADCPRTGSRNHRGMPFRSVLSTDYPRTGSRTAFPQRAFHRLPSDRISDRRLPSDRISGTADRISGGISHNPRTGSRDSTLPSDRISGSRRTDYPRTGSRDLVTLGPDLGISQLLATLDPVHRPGACGRSRFLP
jgi:hypothetical protein